MASGGTKNLNGGTLKNIALAWILTLPVCIAVAYLLFLFFHLFCIEYSILNTYIYNLIYKIENEKNISSNRFFKLRKKCNGICYEPG